MRRCWPRGPFAAHAEGLTALSTFGLRGVPSPEGRSQLGGHPRLPPDVSWPSHTWSDGETTSLDFIGHFALDGRLLAVFHRARLEDDDACRVISVSDGDGEREPPADVEVARRVALDLVGELSIPTVGVEPASALAALGLSDESIEEYDELCLALLDAQGIDDGPRLLGWPWLIIDDVFETWSAEDPSVAEWTLLLQTDIYDTASLYVGVPSADLAAGRFDRSRACTQF